MADEKTIKTEFKKQLKGALRLCDFGTALEMAEAFQKAHAGDMQAFALHWLLKTCVKACKILQAAWLVTKEIKPLLQSFKGDIAEKAMLLFSVTLYYNATINTNLEATVQ